MIEENKQIQKYKFTCVHGERVKEDEEKMGGGRDSPGNAPGVGKYGREREVEETKLAAISCAPTLCPQGSADAISFTDPRPHHQATL